MTEPVELGVVGSALGLGDHELIALVGGGGKTTLMLALGHQLPGRVLLTTTTKVGAHQTHSVATLTDPDDDEIAAAMEGGSPIFVRRAIDGRKSLGVDPGVCDHWFDLVDHVVVEADGARGHPFTAPRPHEPVIPPATTTVLACIGGDALGRVIADQCHCPLRVAALAGCSPYERLTPARAARVLASARGSSKNRPPTARLVVVVTKVDDAARPFATELTDIVEPDVPVLLVAFDPYPTPDYPPDR